ncbi:sortase [Candidatus Microgenomates bacterium]|nr:MAG: sortase [Candidatus Microgenomates bacterium]
MPKVYYKAKNKNLRKKFRILSLFLSLSGILTFFYIFSPLISWQVYFAPVFASSAIEAPIPKSTIVNPSSITSLISNATSLGVDYNNPQNWFPGYKTKSDFNRLISYTLSIPSLGIKDAVVSTVDNDLDKHLVNYSGTAVPPDNGNTVIYGHSTLPQLFNPKDYKTIFATLYKIKIGDEFFININNIAYAYRIHSITIVDPSDTSIFTQDSDGSHVTLVTCTPPGTTWKRLIIKADLEKI